MGFVNNRVIAKNTIFLYFRMIILMIVSLYTSRVILQVLGIDDYGIYNLIGGFITLFSFISNAMVTAMQRFFNVALGHEDREQFHRIYSMGISLFIVFSAFLLFVGETLGVWFVSNVVNIPEGREAAALWVWHVSLLTAIVSLLRAPDNAAIIAHEKMAFYAYLSVAEAVIKLLIVYLLQLFAFDKLILYVLLYLAATLVINIAFAVFCRTSFSECRYSLIWDKPLAKEMMSFSGWSMLTGGMNVARVQGENFIINIFYSVAVNAARGVASQVYNAVNLFLVNFQTAFRPQIVKTYASGEIEEHYRLLYRTSRLSYFLMLALVVPISFNLEPLLSAWLVEVPEYTRDFIVFLLIAYLFDSVGNPFATSVSANGNIRGMQCASSVVYLIELIGSYIALKLHGAPYLIAVLTMGTHFLLMVCYIYYSKKLCGISVGNFLSEVGLLIFKTTLVSLLLPVILIIVAPSGGFWTVLTVLAIDVIWVAAMVFICGLREEERQYVLQLVRRLTSK